MLVVTSVIVDRRTNSGNDVVDERVIPAGSAIAKNRDPFPFTHEAREFVNRKIRALAWPINCEEAQTYRAYTIKMCVGVAEQLAGGLCCRVRGDWLPNGIVFAEWYLRVDAIFPRQLQKFHRAVDVCFRVKQRLFQGRAHACTCSQMHNISKSVLVENSFKRRFISNVRFE